MGWQRKPFLLLFLYVLNQGQLSSCEPALLQNGDQHVDVPNDVSSESNVEFQKTESLPADKETIMDEINLRIAEKEQLKKERQSYLLAEREKNLARKEELEALFLAEEARQKEEDKMKEAAKEKLGTDTEKLSKEIQMVQRQVWRLRYTNPKKKVLAKELNDKKLERAQLQVTFQNEVKAIMDARKARVAELQNKSDKAMAERRKTQEEVEKEMTEMDETMKAYDAELIQLKAELQAIQS